VKLNLYNNLNKLKTTFRYVAEYIFPIKKITKKFTKINSLDKLQIFIQERSAHVTQTTLYGYIKTRIGSRHALMFNDEVYVKSINIAKWNIYVEALSDFTIYTFSYLIDKKNLKENKSEKIYFSILEKEILNGLDEKLANESKIEFSRRLKTINWNTYHSENPFSKSAQALYRWSPIADNLKILDKEIVLNSMKLKWNLVENEFKEVTKDLNFN
tara:strand:+ start:427 stop:1068 length:642 start_codon:yes stop_codon:yes gene_type:complete